MKQNYNLLLLIPLLALACNTHTGMGSKEVVIKNHWYKRYTGTVAGEQVIANLFFDGNVDTKDSIFSVGGNYYYRGKSDLLDLQQEDEATGDEIIFTEYTASDETGNKKTDHPHWKIHLGDSGIAGTWTSSDGQRSVPIKLKENYTPGSWAFDIITLADSAKIEGKKGTYQINTEFNLPTPSASTNKEDAQFIIKAILHELGGDTLGAKTIKELITAANKCYFTDYKTRLAEKFKDKNGYEGESDNWEKTMDGTILYNDRGIVVFGFDAFDYSGGSHPNTNSKYICLDVFARKVMQLTDILKIDTPGLQAILNQAARKRYGIKSTDALAGRLLVNIMPISQNFIISETGITFHYNAAAITPYVDGDAYFYITYSQMGEMVNPEFRKRMKY